MDFSSSQSPVIEPTSKPLSSSSSSSAAGSLPSEKMHAAAVLTPTPTDPVMVITTTTISSSKPSSSASSDGIPAVMPTLRFDTNPGNEHDETFSDSPSASTTPNNSAVVKGHNNNHNNGDNNNPISLVPTSKSTGSTLVPLSTSDPTSRPDSSVEPSSTLAELVNPSVLPPPPPPKEPSLPSLNTFDQIDSNPATDQPPVVSSSPVPPVNAPPVPPIRASPPPPPHPSSRDSEPAVFNLANAKEEETFEPINAPGVATKESQNVDSSKKTTTSMHSKFAPHAAPAPAASKDNAVASDASAPSQFISLNSHNSVVALSAVVAAVVLGMVILGSLFLYKRVRAPGKSAARRLESPKPLPLDMVAVHRNNNFVSVPISPQEKPCKNLLSPSRCHEQRAIPVLAGTNSSAAVGAIGAAGAGAGAAGAGAGAAGAGAAGAGAVGAGAVGAGAGAVSAAESANAEQVMLNLEQNQVQYSFVNISRGSWHTDVGDDEPWQFTLPEVVTDSIVEPPANESGDTSWMDRVSWQDASRTAAYAKYGDF